MAPAEHVAHTSFEVKSVPLPASVTRKSNDFSDARTSGGRVRTLSIGTAS